MQHYADNHVLADPQAIADVAGFIAAITRSTLSAMRARQINAYFNQLGEGLGAIVPPQVTSVARKPLSIAFEEIAADKILPVYGEELAAKREAEAEATAARLSEGETQE